MNTLCHSPSLRIELTNYCTLRVLSSTRPVSAPATSEYHLGSHLIHKYHCNPNRRSLYCVIRHMPAYYRQRFRHTYVQQLNRYSMLYEDRFSSTCQVNTERIYTQQTLQYCQPCSQCQKRYFPHLTETEDSHCTPREPQSERKWTVNRAAT